MKKILFIVILFTSLISKAQSSNFDIYLKPISMAGLPGLQSFAFGQYQGKWIIVGGRLDGLHRRQPWASFDLPGHNKQVYIVDPSSSQVWSSPLTSLSQSIQDQLSSTNMQFYQHDSFLYCLGGYGYNTSSADKITFANLTAINMPILIDAVINSTTINAAFRQISDPQFALTGGRLEKIYSTWYLVGGQKFDGDYNPMGNPTYTQTYSNQIRKFLLADDGININITHLASITDTANLHRRDYNMSAQIMPNGQEGLTAVSGVFQTSADIPYLNCVNIDSNGMQVTNACAQYYNHYHCAHLTVYEASSNHMHTVFFGGIAQYFDNAGVLVQDNNVPFVNTIARVTRDGSGLMTEYKLPVEMPSLLGAGSEFIPKQGLPRYPNQVLKFDNLIGDTNLVGHIVGGISSTGANIFTFNSGTQSAASNQIFEVYIIKNKTVGIHDLNEQSIGSLHLQVYPNPNEGKFEIDFNLNEYADVQIKLIDAEGKTIISELLKGLNKGSHHLSYQLNSSSDINVYTLMVQTKNEKAIQKVIINP